MSNINALIAAGPHTQGVDVRGNAIGAQQIATSKSRNALYDLQAQNYPAEQARATAQETRLQNQENRLQSQWETVEELRQGTGLKYFLDKGDIQGAIGFVSKDGITEKEKPVLALLQSGDQTQIESLKGTLGQLIHTATAIGDIERPAAAPARKKTQGADGFWYYDDTKERVLPGVEQAQSEGGDVRDRKIADLQRLNQNVDEAQATKLVDGQAHFELNEKTGKVLYIDDVEKTVTEIQVSGGGQETPAPRQGQTLRELAGTATGIIPGLTAKAAAVGALGNIETDEQSTAAQQTFNTHTTALIRALSINPRFPVAEMERIQKEVNIKPSMFQGAPTLIKKIDSLDASLQVRLQQAERDFNDPNLDVATRQAQGANASALKNFLEILGGNPEQDATDTRIQEIEARLKELRNE